MFPSISPVTVQTDRKRELKRARDAAERLLSLAIDSEAADAAMTAEAAVEQVALALAQLDLDDEALAEELMDRVGTLSAMCEAIARRLERAS